jgi:hypothetical protein
MARFLIRWRPLLWVAALVVVAVLISFTWESQTSYDDGGIGTASFLVITVSAIPGQALGLGYGASLFLAVLGLVIADVLLRRALVARAQIGK